MGLGYWKDSMTVNGLWVIVDQVVALTMLKLCYVQLKMYVTVYPQHSSPEHTKHLTNIMLKITQLPKIRKGIQQIITQLLLLLC